MRKEISIKVADVAKVLFKILNLFQGFSWETYCLLLISAGSGFILSLLSLGTCKQSRKFTVMCIPVSIPCMSVRVFVHVYPMCECGRPGIPMTASSKVVIGNLLREQSDFTGSVLLLCMLSTPHVGLKGKQPARAHLLLSATLHWCESTLIWLLVRTG